MSEQRFLLEVNIQVVQCGEYPPGSKNWQPVGGRGLEVKESSYLTASGFMEVAGVLGRFHDLTESLRKEGEGGNPEADR